MKQAALPRSPSIPPSADAWPSLPFTAWQDTCATLHLWMQVVGKIRLARAPLVNHWWQVPLYVTCCGLTTSPIPDEGRSFAIDFDFIEHRLHIVTSDGRTESFALVPCTVADFYHEVMGRLRTLGIEPKIWTMPVEIPDAFPFETDQIHAAYDAEYANRFWRALGNADRLFKTFRADFIGKVSPVHFFWGSFDLAVTRFSGRTAPPFPGAAPHVGKWVMQEAYSHEVSSLGFWPGNGGFGQAAFYSYAYPQPPGYAEAATKPCVYDTTLSEFILPYDVARQSASPDQCVLDFAQSTYEAAANAAKWDRVGLERKFS